MSVLARFVTVAAGYLAALALAIGGIIAYRYLNPPIDPDDSMRDFGDAFLFCGMFALFALVPTGLGFYFLRGVKWFWYAAAAVALALNALGILAEISLRRPNLGPTEPLAALGTLTILGSPVLALGFLIGALVTTIPAARNALFVATVMEALVFVAYIVHVVISRA